MHVVNVCEIRDRALLMEETLIFIVKDHFLFLYIEKERLVRLDTLLVEITYIFVAFNN